METVSSLNLLTVFMVIGGIGILLLLVSLVIGDIFDALGFDFDLGSGGADFGLLDSRVLSVFFTAFGGFGAIGVQMGWGAVASSVAGLAGGLVFGAVVSLFGRFLVGQQASSSVTDNDLIGRTAQVTVAIKPGEIGQIACRIGDERVEKLARTTGTEEIRAGSVVKVDSVVGDSVLVSPESTSFLSS